MKATELVFFAVIVFLLAIIFDVPAVTDIGRPNGPSIEQRVMSAQQEIGRSLENGALFGSQSVAQPGVQGVATASVQERWGDTQLHTEEPASFEFEGKQESNPTAVAQSVSDPMSGPIMMDNGRWYCVGNNPQWFYDGYGLPWFAETQKRLEVAEGTDCVQFFVNIGW